MAQDKLDILYDALERDGAVTRGRENFRAKMLAPGEEGYKNRLALFTALKQDNAVKSNTYEEFAANLGLHAVKPAKQEDPAEEQGGAAQPNADDYARASKNNALAVARGRDVLHQAENAQEWQKANFGLNVPKVELGLGKSGRTVATAPTFNAKTGKQERTYITQSGNEYTSQASAEREQAALDKQQEQARKLAHVQEEIDRKRQEELAGIDKQLTVMREQYDRIKGTDHTSETRKGYIMQAIDRLQQQRDAAEKKYRGRDVKAEYELGGGREQLEAAKEEVAKALEDIEERRGEKSGFMEFAESQFPNVTSYIRRWTDPEYGKAKAAEQALEDTENTIKQATREGFSNNTAFNVARGAWDATRDIRTWDFGANDWADSRNLAELVDKSERIRKAEEAGKTPEEHLTATEQRVLDAMAVSSTLDANFSEHVPMSYRVGQSVPASAGFAASIYLNPLNRLGAAVEKQVAANAAKGGMKEVLKGAMKTAGKTVMKNVTGAPTMNAAEQSMQRALTVAAVNKYGKWGVRAMNTAGRVIGDGVEALGTTLTTGLPRTMASINERQAGTFIGRVDDSGHIVYDRVEDRETGAKSYLKGGLASYFENQSELVGEYFSPIKNFANLAAKDMPLARSMVERFIASSPKQKASLLAEFRKKAHISGLFGEYAEEVINNLENAVFTGDMNLTGGVFEPKRENYKSDAEYNKAVNKWKGSMFNAETNLETFLSVAAMIMPMAAIEQGQKRYNSYTVKRQLNTSADALRKSLGEETAVPLMTRMREAESIKDICDVYMSVLKDGGLKDSKQARALMDYAGKLVAYQSVNTSDMSGEISANRVQRGYKSAFDAGHEMAADERHNAAVEFDNAAATATEMLGKDFVMAVQGMDLPQFQEILKTLNWEQKKAATDVYLSSVRLSGIMAGAHDRVDEEADKYGNTLNLMSDEDGNAWRGSNLGENEYVVPSSLSDEGNTLVVRDMGTGALRMIPREEAGELTAVNASEETEARRKQLWEQAKDEVRWNLNHHNKTVQPAVGETVSISMRKSEDEGNETQRFLIVKEDEDGNFYLLPTRMNEAGEEEAISGTPFKATADELLSSQDYVYEREDAVQRDAERSAVEETTEGGATEETPTDGSSVVIEGTPATEEDAPADTAAPTRSEVAAQLDATEEGRSARAMVDGWVRDENDAETIHEWIDIVDESEWDAKTKQLLHDYVDSKDAPDEEGPTGGSSAVVESEAAPVVEGEAAPAVESKATPKIPQDKDGAPQYDKAPVQATVEDLYDGTLDDKEVGEFIEAQIAEADKNVKKLEKRKPKVGTDKAKYLASKKKWEDELEDARHKAQYWNDVKAEVERITTPADAQGWEGELNDDNARAAYRAQRKAENGIPTQQEFIADFMASAKIAPESFRKETGGGTLEQKQWAGRIAKEGDSIERLSEKLVDLDNTENGGRFFGGDSAAARDAIIDFLKSGRDKTDQEQEFVEQYNAQRDAYYNERYGMSYEDYIAYTEQEMPEMLRRYSNFDEQEFTKLYADEIEEDLRRREEQAKQQNNGTEGNDSAGEEQSDGGSHQVQPGERTDDTRGGEERTDTRAEEDAGDEGAGKPEAAQENAGNEGAGGRPANVGGTPELQGDIPSEERVAPNLSSDKADEYGRPLVLAEDGTTTFGTMDPKSGLKEAPILLSLGENYVGEDGKNHGYGLLHIEAGHGEQIRRAGFSSVEEFVEAVAKNYVCIREGAKIGNTQTYLLELTDTHNNTLFVQLSKDGAYWNINSAGIFKVKYSRRKPKVHSVPALGEDTNTDIPEVNSGHSEGVTAPAGNSSKTSDGKGSTKLLTAQEKQEKQEKGDIFAEAERLAEEERSKREKHSENKEGALLSEQIATASAEVNTEPTEAQKEAGNYKKGHVQVGTFDITIEQPQGSVRKGTDADGKQWENKMNNTYGYIRGTVGVDGDHIDVFLSNDIDGWDGRKVFVVDQYNPDGSFDEHKVMLGFNDADEAKGDYLANYEQGWENDRRIDVSAVNLEDFEKWIESSKRKTKPFSEYKNVKLEQGKNEKNTREEIESHLVENDPDFIKANDHALDVEQNWEEKIQDYLFEHYPTQATLSAETTSEKGQKEREAMKADPVLKELREKANAEYEEADKAVEAAYKKATKAAKDTRLQKTEEVIKGAKWEATPAPEKYKTRASKHADSHATEWKIGKIRYGSTKAETGQIELAVKMYGGYIGAWNAYEQGKILLAPNEAAIIKEIIRTEEAAGQKPHARLQKADEYSEFAAEHGLDGMWLSRYAEGMRERNSAAAAMAFRDLKAIYLREHIAEKKALMERDGVSGLLANKRLFEPVENAIKAKYGDVDVLIEERRKQAEIERGMMEVARRRFEEEQRKREARLKEFAEHTDEEIDNSYAEALAKGDEATAREMLDEAARRKGYGDVESDYQGVGAWGAPSKPDYETDEARRNAVGEDSPDLNVEDMAAGYSNQPEDIFAHPDKYSQGLPTSKESGKAIQTAIDDIRNGKKDVKIKVYRAVPTTVKEGKLRNGDWVTPSKRYAELHGENRLEGKYRIIEDEVTAGDLWWDSNDVNEWGYDNGKNYRYKNVKNNRKLNDLVTRDDNGNIIPPSKRFNSRKADERYQRGKGAAPVTKEETILRDAVIDRMRENGMDVITNEKEGQRVLEEANGKVRLNSMASSLAKAASTIKDWLTNNKRGKTFRIELPLRTSRMVREVMGRDFESHNITANGIAHAQKNHGINGTKLNEKSIPLTKEDMELLPYIMTAPDYVRRGSNDSTGRASVRFYKELSNGYVVVAEKEYKNSPDDMETITMWAEKSDKATNAQRNAAPDTHVQNAILDIDVAKIHKDAEDAIANDVKVRENRVWHGSEADFETFDHSHMGEGEGSQAFGWGTYVTNSKDIGFYYATRIDNDPSKRNYLFQHSNGTRFKNKYPTLESFLQDTKRMAINGKATEQEKIDYYHKMMKLAEPYHNLYAVEIPEDNGKNYLDWDSRVGARVLSKVNRQLEKQGKRPINPELDKRYKFLDGNDLYRALSIRMPNDDATFNDNKAASEFLYSLGFVGIRYKAGRNFGGAKEGDTNYVIFNEKDAKITDHVRFFRTADGEAYGFTVDGKIYIDTKIANSETPVHEYAHLWASALRQSNAKEWANVVGLMKDTAVWEEVKKHYPELKTDDEIADEVLATYSGRRGAERLRKEMEEATKNGSIFDKAEAMSAMQKIRQAFDTFWNSVADFLHIHYTTAEEVADRVMKDLLDGVDPRMMNDGESLERVNERFNEELQQQIDGKLPGNHIYRMGEPGRILLSTGVPDLPIQMNAKKLQDKATLYGHDFDLSEVKNLVKALRHPLAVFAYGNKSKAQNIIVPLQKDGKNFIVGLSLNPTIGGRSLEINSIRNVFPKDNSEWLNWITQGKALYIDKEKIQTLIDQQRTNLADVDYLDLDSVAKIVESFENPKISAEKVSEDDLYRVVDDKETIERLDAEPKITAYRAMQVIDGKLYSPMAAKVDGELTDSNPYGAWTEAEETLLDFTPEQKAAMEALDKSNEPGNVELIKGKLRYNKQSKNGKGTLQFHLVKGDGSSLWAAYNPYIHSSMSMLNDQFTSAYKRPNIVVVEVEIPESELTSGYRAQNAKNTVGLTEWKAGPVAGQLPGDMARQVMLSRWSKVKRIVPYSEVADQVAATLRTAEEKTGQKVQLPIESFHPELRKELEKRGFEFQHGKYTEETAKRKAWDDLTDEEKQQAYKGAAYMDDAAIEALNSEYSGEWLKREGEGQATDEEVSLANDPVSKMIGKSRYSAGQQVEYAENMRERMTTHAQELAEKLHLSNVEIVADGSGFTGKRQKAKGFYNKTTGKITVVIGNHTSMADVEKTILHEAVAHHGLRQLFGEHFDQFLDNVYESCDYKIRQKIDALMEEKGYDQRTATEEYLASLAEDMNYETTDPTFWTAIKEAFLDMLHTLGFDYAGPVLTDNELRYILWRSYKNLEEPGSFRSILGTAEDLKMQETLGVGQYETEGKESAAAEDLFREDDISRAMNNDSEGAGWSRETMQRAWDEVMSKASFLAKEGYFDYLASVDEFQKLVERATGEKVSDMQNAYKAMLQLSSRNANEMKLFDSAFARPLQRAVYRLIGAVKDFKKGKGLELSWYLISKHGIERNRDMAIRAAMKEKAKDSYAEQIHEATAELKEERTQLLAELTRIAAGEESTLGTEAAIKARVKQIEAEIDSIKKHPNKHGLKTEAEFYEDELDNWYRTASFIKEYAEENGWTWRETQEELTRRAADFGADVTEDYSGLSALVEEEEDFTEAAYRRVENYENTHYTDDLWEAIRAMSGYSLEKQRSSGLTTKKYVDDQLRRYDFFVPLRGWADPTAEEMYDYLDGQRSELGNPVKTAKGRKSEADNPLGGLLSVAYRSIASGNKNMALQHFYNLMSAHNTNGLAVIDSMWVENRGTEDAPDWVLATPELTDPMTGGREMSAEEVQAELDRFNTDMREKAALGMAIQMKKGTPLPPYRVTQQHARAHQIRLSVGGTNRVITIVGNPRVAMALNGLLNPENSGWPILRKLNNFMAGAFTNYNVSFGGANLARDTAHSNLRAFIGESPAYWWALTKKQNLLLGNVANWARMVGMLRKYEAGKPMTGYHERMFKEFMDGGGATGYTMIRNQKESTQFMVDMVRDLKNIKRRKLSPMRMFEFFSFLNEAAELVNRFVAYETSREMGRTRERSIDDAKEATLNFNRKGAGAKSLTQREGAKYRLSNALNYYSQYGRSFIVFFNAHVQGTYQLYRLVKEHPAKFAFAFGAAPVTAAAVALPLFNNLLLPAIYSAVGGDGDDDWGDYYYELSDWERQHNICLRLPKGHGWLKIPLTPELGAMFQVGDVTGASFAGKRDMQASDFAGIMELVAPNNVDFTNAGTAISSLVPSSLQWASHIAVNRDFKGSRLRNDNMFSRYQPEYLKATRSTSATITAMSRALNKVGGGNDERSADNVLDFSPGYAQEMLTGIAGGWASTALAVSDALAAPYLEGGGSEKDYWKGAKGLFDRGGVPVLSRFWISGSGERNAARAKGEYMRTVKPFMGATESEFSLIKRIPRPAALDVRAKEEKLEAAKKSHDLFAIAEAEKALESAKANFEEAKKTQRQKLDALQGSERFKAYRDMRGITRYIDYMLRLYKDNDLPANVVDSLQEANRRLLEVEK
nr:MAG TPA: Large polyvalent protein associated domain 38 [Caudoviricetes sp.]